MKCFYHNDMDGRCAGAIVKRYSEPSLIPPNKEEFIEVDYVMNLPLENIKQNETVYFVDYSFKENTLWQLEKVLEKTKNIIWIDHHTSSIELEKKVNWLKDIKGIRQDGISGAALTYMYLHKCDFENIPLFIRLVSDYDCWQYKYEPDTTYFKIGLETNSFDVFDIVWEKLFDDVFCKNPYDYTFTYELIDKGELIKSYIDNDNNYYRSHFAYESEIDGLKCLVINKKSNSWIFGEKYKEYPLVMVWVFDGAKYTYSIYSSNESIDCSKIADKFGGGGHKGAAGFSSDKLLFKKTQ